MSSNVDPCTFCGGTSTQQTEGQLYCRNCGTQIENFNEYDQEEEALVMFRSSIKKKKKDVPTREIGQEEEELLHSMRLDSQDDKPKRRKTDLMCEEFGETALTDKGKKEVDLEPQERTAHLRVISRSIVIFVDQLIKAAKIIAFQHGFPKKYPEQCFAVFQHYLQNCGVAFVDFEFTDDLENMVRILKIGSKSDFKNKSLKEKERLKVKRKLDGIKRLQKSENIWSTLADQTLGEDLALRGNDDGEEGTSKPNKSTDVTRFDEIGTKLSFASAYAARAIYLEADALVAILHISALNIGVQFSMLSDIVRWFREDRIRIHQPFHEKKGRRFLNPQEVEHVFGGCKGRERFNIPLFEYERCSLWIWQSLNLPSLTINIDYQQLSARTLYHLNLPSGLMQRMSMLMQLAPPNDSLSSDALKLQGDIDQGVSCNDFCNLRSKWNKVCGFERIRYVFGRSKARSEETDVFFTTETKIMAYILMSLKLMYGLNDSSDGSEISAGEENVFNISDWMLQLKMRLMLCEGYDPFDVLQSERPVHDILPDIPLRVAHGSRFITLQDKEEGVKTSLTAPFRGLGFTNCIPNLSVVESSFNIPNALSDFVSYRSFEKNSDNAIYAPVRHQPDIIHDFFEKNKIIGSEHYKDVDKMRLKLLNRQYDDYELHPETANVDGSGFLASVHSVERCATNKERREWQELFPCASTYTRYPRPLWAQSNVGALTEDNSYLQRLNRMSRMKKNDMAVSGPQCFFASKRCVNDLFMAAEKSMSENFRELLQNCSKIIGEDVAVLYTAFVMLEYQIVERAEFHELAQKLIHRVASPLNMLRFNKDGECTNHVVQVTSDVDISDRRELCWLRFGVPKDFGASFWNVEEALNDADAEWVDSDSDKNKTSDSDNLSDPEDEISETPSRINEETLEERLRRSTPRFLDTAYDFDTIWQMVTMRYW